MWKASRKTCAQSTPVLTPEKAAQSTSNFLHHQPTEVVVDVIITLAFNDSKKPHCRRHQLVVGAASLLG